MRGIEVRSMLYWSSSLWMPLGFGVDDGESPHWASIWALGGVPYTAVYQRYHGDANQSPQRRSDDATRRRYQVHT